MKLLKLLVMVMVLGLVFAGCSSKGKTKGSGDLTGTGAADGSGGPEIGKYGDGSGDAYGSGGGKGGKYGAGGGEGALDDPNSPLSKRVIYFGYDSSEVAPEYLSVVNEHATFLASNPSKTVTLEGNTDERGSPEYNIALGEQRAKAVAKLMKLQGVSDTQLQIVSFGEEKPADSGHDESAYQQNRRVELSYPGH